MTDVVETLRRQLAAYQGAVSRWCDLNGKAADGNAREPKLDQEFKAFTDHLSAQATANRKPEDWKF